MAGRWGTGVAVHGVRFKFEAASRVSRPCRSALLRTIVPDSLCGVLGGVLTGLLAHWLPSLWFATLTGAVGAGLIGAGIGAREAARRAHILNRLAKQVRRAADGASPHHLCNRLPRDAAQLTAALEALLTAVTVERQEAAARVAAAEARVEASRAETERALAELRGRVQDLVRDLCERLSTARLLASGGSGRSLPGPRQQLEQLQADMGGLAARLQEWLADASCDQASAGERLARP